MTGLFIYTLYMTIVKGGLNTTWHILPVNLELVQYGTRQVHKQIIGIKNKKDQLID